MSGSMEGVAHWAATANSTNVALFQFAKGVTGDKVDRCGAGEATIGIFTEVNGITTPATVQLSGVGKITLAGTLAAGAEVESDASGHAVALSSGKKCGTLLTGGVSGNIVSIKLV